MRYFIFMTVNKTNIHDFVNFTSLSLGITHDYDLSFYYVLRFRINLQSVTVKLLLGFLWSKMSQITANLLRAVRTLLKSLYSFCESCKIIEVCRQCNEMKLFRLIMFNMNL